MKRATILVFSLILVLFAYGCSQYSAPYSQPAPVQPAPSTSQTKDVLTTATSSIGTIMVGTNGMAIYMFAADTGGISTCYSTCATYWPPLLVASGVTPTGQGISATLGVVQRTDGTFQVTANGWPLYYFAGDKAPGDLNGQALVASGAAWYVLDPTGAQITTKVPAGSTTTTTPTTTTAATPVAQPAPAASAPMTYEVTIKGFAFSPATQTIQKGDTVVWTNQDSVGHTIASDSGSVLSSPTIANGGTYQHTFDTAGTYAYHCTIHPSMHGTIVVQ